MSYSQKDLKKILNMSFPEEITKEASLIADEIEQENEFTKVAEFYSDYGVARAESDIAKIAFSRFEKVAAKEEDEEDSEAEKEKDFEDVDEETIKKASVYADYIFENYAGRLADRGLSDFNDPTHYFDVLSKTAGIEKALATVAQTNYTLGRGAGKDYIKSQNRARLFGKVKDKIDKLKQVGSKIDSKITSPIEEKIKEHYLNKDTLSRTDLSRYKNRKGIARGIAYGGLGIGAAGVGAGAVAASRFKNKDSDKS